MMGLVAPMMNGIGGDLFAIVYDAKSGKLYGLNASGWAPAGLTIQFLKDQGIRDMPQRGIHSVTVPGAVDGWEELLDRFGTKKFADVLAPAIRAAEDGFPVTEWAAAAWEDAADSLRATDAAAQTFCPRTRAGRRGKSFAIPIWPRRCADRARRPRRLLQGRDRQRIVDTSRRHGGTMAADDLADYSAEWVDPISTDYRGWTVYEMPPNEQGIAALRCSTSWRRSRSASGGTTPRRAARHDRSEEARLCRLIRYVGDPHFAKVPVAELLSEGYAAAARQADRSGQGELQRRPGHAALRGATPPISPSSIATATWCR